MKERKFLNQFLLRIFLLILLCILPSYELVKLRLFETVSTQETEKVDVQLRDNEIFSQQIELKKGTHVTELSIGMSSYLENENAQVLVTVSQGDTVCTEVIMQGDIPVNGMYELQNVDFSQYSDGIITIDIQPSSLYEGDFFVQTVQDVIYGYENGICNGQTVDGTLNIQYTGWSIYNEGVIYSFAWILVILVFIVLASWLMTYQKDNIRFDKYMQIVTFVLIIAVFSVLYPSFLWYGCDWCEGIFYYKKIQENTLFDIIFSSDFDLYMAQFNNVFMYLFVKVFGIDTYTFVACQLLSIGMVAYWGTLFCKRQYEKYFPIDLRVGLAIVSVCYLYTMQEFSFIGIAYFGALYLLYIITYDFSNDRLAYILAIPMMLILCTSKMSFGLFFPIALFLLFAWRGRLSKRNRILLWVMSFSCFLEVAGSILLNGGLQGGGSLGTVQSISVVDLIFGAVYYSIQLANSVFFHEMNFANALLINVLMFAVLAGLILWSLREMIQKRRYEKVAGLMFSMLAIVYGNCLLQLLTNSYSMTVANVHWDEIFYIPVEDKWWWYAFGYVALWAIMLIVLYIATSFIKEKCLTKDDTEQNWYQCGTIIVSLVLCIITVNQYAYHGNDLQSYKAENMFTMPSMMQGNFAEYSFMQKDDQFMIVTSFKPKGLDWYYVKDVQYVSAELDGRYQMLDFGEDGNIGVGTGISLCSIHVHKDAFTNQMKDGKYVIRLYDKNGNEMGCYEQIDTDLSREYICFYFGGEIARDIEYMTFEYEDGTPAYIDSEIRLGVAQ